MPKIVDHESLRESLAEAAWRVISRGGLEAATFRAVAKEAGISLGALQHYFKSQEELFLFCMSLANQRCAERISGLEYPPSRPFLEHLKTILHELLPLDGERAVFAKVYYSFALKSLYSTELESLNQEINRNLRAIYEQTIDLLFKFGVAREGLDVPKESDRLFALIDGLSLHALLSPATMSPRRIDELLDDYLRSLCDLGKLREKSP
jgi:AcrR family transcriptional regulator